MPQEKSTHINVYVGVLVGNRRGKGGDVLRRREFRLARIVLIVAFGFAMFWAGAANRDDVVQAQRLATVGVVVRSNGTERRIRTTQATVAAALKEAGIEVGPLDKVTPAASRR